MNECKVSAAMMRQPFHPCDPDFIRDVCKARCCESSTAPGGTLITIHPTEQARIEALGGRVRDGRLEPSCRRCPFKTPENLCSIHGPSQPFGCIASPFTLTKKGTLVVRNRYRALKCFKAPGAVPIYKAHSVALAVILGWKGAVRLAAHLDAGGGDIQMPIDPAVAALLLDNDAAKKEPAHA